MDELFGVQQDESTLLLRLVDELVISLVNTRVYSSSHTRVQWSTMEASRLLGELLGFDDTAGLRLPVVRECFVHDGHPLVDASLASSRLIKAIHDHKGGGLHLDRAATQADFQMFFEELTRKAGAQESAEAFNQRLQERGCRTVRLLAPMEEDALRRQDARVEEQLVLHGIPLALPLYQALVDHLQGLTIQATQGRKLGFESTQGAVDKLLEQLAKDSKSLLGMARYELYDAFTFGHSIRVCLLALNFARTLTDDLDLLNRIGTAALLHDLGKVRVSFETLYSRERLTEEQRREMERHPVFGAEILLDNGDTDPLAIAVAFGHHHTVDMRGYPKVLHRARGAVVPRIVKICDVFEALTAPRPYKAAMPAVRAYRIMLSMRNHFDPLLLRRFIAVTGFYPTGTMVALSNGVQGKVDAQTHDPRRPVVEIRTTEGGEALAPHDRRLLDLAHCDPAIRVLASLGEATIQGAH